MDDLDIRIPESARVISRDPTRTITGQRFSEMDMSEPGEGFLPLRNLGAERSEQRDPAGMGRGHQ